MDAAQRLQPQGGEAIDVSAGEVVLLPHNSAHTFGSELNPAPVPAGEIIQPPQDGRLARIVYGGGGAATTQLLCGVSWL